MAKKVSKKGGGSKKHGRNKAKCKAYRDRGRRFVNKLRRVLKSNGPDAAARYRQTYR